jgi:very-short-patch-repair endonuclease
VRAPVITFKRARTFRREMTLPEVLLWQSLRGGRLEGLRFRRQHPIGAYILDFFCSEASLAVEIDGNSHDHAERALHDGVRDSWLGKQGIIVLRFAACDVLDETKRPDVLTTIAAAAAPSTAFGGPPPPAARVRIQPREGEALWRATST